MFTLLRKLFFFFFHRKISESFFFEKKKQFHWVLWLLWNKRRSMKIMMEKKTKKKKTPAASVSLAIIARRTFLLSNKWLAGVQDSVLLLFIVHDAPPKTILPKIKTHSFVCYCERNKEKAQYFVFDDNVFLVFHEKKNPEEKKWKLHSNVVRWCVKFHTRKWNRDCPTTFMRRRWKENL